MARSFFFCVCCGYWKCRHLSTYFSREKNKHFHFPNLFSLSPFRPRAMWWWRRWLKITRCALPTTRGIRNGSLPSNAWGGLSCLHFLEALGLEDKSNSRFPNEMWRLFVSLLPFCFETICFCSLFSRGGAGTISCFCLPLSKVSFKPNYVFPFSVPKAFFFPVHATEMPRPGKPVITLFARVGNSSRQALYTHCFVYIWEKRLFSGGKLKFRL